MKKYYFKFLFVILFSIFNYITLIAQKQGQKLIDSLIMVLPNAKEDTNKVILLDTLSYCYRHINPDNGIEYGFQGLELSKKLSYKDGEAKSYSRIAQNYTWKNEFQKALEYDFKAFEIYEKIGDKRRMAINLGDIGNIYQSQSDFTKALEYDFKSLKLYEEIDWKEGIAIIYGNIGNIYWNQHQYSNAIVYDSMALKIYEQLGTKEGIARNLANIGNVYLDQSDYSNALFNFNKALNIYEELGNKSGIASNLINIGNIYLELSDYANSMDYNTKALKIYEELRNKTGIATCLGTIGSIYFSMGTASGKNGYPIIQQSVKVKYLNNAIENLEKSLSIYKELNIQFEEKRILSFLSNVYRELGNYRKAYETYVQSQVIKDSIFSIEEKKSIANLESKQKVALLEKDKQQKIIIIYASISGFILVLLIALFIFRSYTIKKRVNIQLNEKNEIISQANIELEYLNNDLSQKNLLITEQNTNIISSINYAQRIQQAILPLEERIEISIQDFFIFYKPRDIVSGDFYWFSEIEDTIIFAVCDCTGHGVPGAFMSMIGNDLLNEIVNRLKIINPADILMELNNGVHIALKQNAEESLSQDGMDVAIVSINKNNHRIEFAGAKRPLYYNLGVELKELKGDNLSIGGKQRKTDVEFTNHLLKLIPSNSSQMTGDVKLSEFNYTTFYLTSDGFADIHNTENQKYGTRRFKELLQKISQFDVRVQKEMLENEFEEFKKGEKSRDDVTVVGIKLKLLPEIQSENVFESNRENFI